MIGNTMNNTNLFGSIFVYQQKNGDVKFGKIVHQAWYNKVLNLTIIANDGEIICPDYKKGWIFDSMDGALDRINIILESEINKSKAPKKAKAKNEQLKCE